MMPFEFIDFAQRLAIQPASTPATLRTVTSRAYYGSFHLAKELLVRLGQPVTGKHDAHAWLVGSKCDEAHQAGRLLAELNNESIKADYDLADRLAETINIARRNVERATDLQNLLKKCETLQPADVVARRMS